jgi:zinc/manganese transport system permease protein
MGKILARGGAAAAGVLAAVLLAAGPASAHVTVNPKAGIAVASVWIGLTASCLVPKLPPSFAILAVATVAYLGAIGVSRLRQRQPAAGAGRSGLVDLPA